MCQFLLSKTEMKAKTNKQKHRYWICFESGPAVGLGASLSH